MNLSRLLAIALAFPLTGLAQGTFQCVLEPLPGKVPRSGTVTFSVDGDSGSIAAVARFEGTFSLRAGLLSLHTPGGAVDMPLGTPAIVDSSLNPVESTPTSVPHFSRYTLQFDRMQDFGAWPTEVFVGHDFRGERINYLGGFVTPVPEPCVSLMLAAGLMVLMGRRAWLLRRTVLPVAGSNLRQDAVAALSDSQATSLGIQANNHSTIEL
jgi:hypothetical protein